MRDWQVMAGLVLLAHLMAASFIRGWWWPQGKRRVPKAPTRDRIGEGLRRLIAAEREGITVRLANTEDDARQLVRCFPEEDKVRLFDALVWHFDASNDPARLFHESLRRIRDATPMGELRSLPGDEHRINGERFVQFQGANLLGPLETNAMVGLIGGAVRDPRSTDPDRRCFTLQVVRVAAPETGQPWRFILRNGVQHLGSFRVLGEALVARDELAMMLATIWYADADGEEPPRSSADVYTQPSEHCERTIGLRGGDKVWTGTYWERLPDGDGWLQLYDTLFNNPGTPANLLRIAIYREHELIQRALTCDDVVVMRVDAGPDDIATLDNAVTHFRAVMDRIGSAAAHTAIRAALSVSPHEIEQRPVPAPDPIPARDIEAWPTERTEDVAFTLRSMEPAAISMLRSIDQRSIRHGDVNFMIQTANAVLASWDVLNNRTLAVDQEPASSPPTAEPGEPEGPRRRAIRA